ncbi:MAG: mechanosensitive ion channel [Polyangiaceae bacterium]|nr:mechanosensitive ion channel [Polyangiaceae bacterium]
MALEKIFRDLVTGSALLGVIGLIAAVLLLFITRFLLPKKGERLLRVPAFFLFVHMGAMLLRLVVPEEASITVAIKFVSLLALLFAFGRLIGLLVLEVVLGRRMQRPVPAILRDIAQGVLYLFLLLGALRALGFDPGSILTTGAVVTAVIGLSLQETLGNLVAGLSIQMQRPFDVGDWIAFDNEKRHIGRVVEINWRATKVVTLDDVEVIVPNGMLAKAPIVNFTKPTKSSRRSVYISVAYEVPPRRVHEVILDALRDTPGVLTDPAPSVVTNNFAESGIEYWVRFWTDQFDKRDGVDGGVRDRIYYALHRANFTIPFPQRTVHLHQVSDETRAREDASSALKRESALGNVDILSVLDRSVLKRLATLATTRLFSPGETIVRQDDDADELYIIERGTVVVLLESAGKETSEVTRLGPGQFFGEMALVTGEKRQATVRAYTECELMVIGHEPFHDVLSASPNLVKELSRVLAERQTMLDEHAESMPMSDREREVNVKSLQFIDRIKHFFQL